MKNLSPERLHIMENQITQICKISGVPGLSIGVVHNGTVIYRMNYGLRDVNANLPTTSDTIFGIGSISKAFVGIGLASAIDDGKASWDSVVSTILLSFNSIESIINLEMTILDLVSHRSGLATINSLWLGNDGELLLKKEDTIPTMNAMPLVGDFRGQFQYNNWGFALAGEVLEELVGKPWEALIHETIFKPLDMTRTRTAPCEDHDVAKPYAALDDTVLLPFPPMQDGTIISAAGGVRSTVNDLLKFSTALMSAYQDQSPSQQEPTTGTPLKKVPFLFQSYITMNPDHPVCGYGVGWVVIQLPGPMGAIGCNGMYVTEMPTVASGAEKTLAVYHQGSMAGYTSTLVMLPEHDIAIVVLTNSIHLNDASDWIAQLLVETILDSAQRNDFIVLAQESASKQIAQMPEIARAFKAEELPGTAKPLHLHTGRYYNQAGNFFLSITETEDGLQLAFQGQQSQVWKLKHVRHDKFQWLMSRNESVRRARFPYAPKIRYEIGVEEDSSGCVRSLLWVIEPGQGPERFEKLVEFFV